MNCQDFESKLNDVLDQRKDPRQQPEIIAHAAECDPCNSTLEIYAALGEYSQPIRTVTMQDRKRKSGYVLTATAAAVLLLLLSPIGDFFSQNRDRLNLAHANTPIGSEIKTSTADPVIPHTNGLNPQFWQNSGIASIVPPIPFQVPKAPNLQDVGQSINSVWKSIQEDDYLLPIIKQSALFWMPK